jgi:hypothetical protein
MVYAFNFSDVAVNPVAKFGDIATLLNVLLPLITIGAAFIFLIMLLYGAFTWLTAGDNAENVKKAQKLLVNAVLGLIIILFSYVIVKIIGLIFKIPLLI